DRPDRKPRVGAPKHGAPDAQRLDAHVRARLRTRDARRRDEQRDGERRNGPHSHPPERSSDRDPPSVLEPASMRRGALLFLTLLGGCSTCSPHTVTFGLDAGTATPPTPQDEVDLGVTFVPVEAHELPDATRNVDVEGAQVLAPSGTSTSL